MITIFLLLVFCVSRDFSLENTIPPSDNYSKLATTTRLNSHSPLAAFDLNSLAKVIAIHFSFYEELFSQEIVINQVNSHYLIYQHYCCAIVNSLTILWIYHLILQFSLGAPWFSISTRIALCSLPSAWFTMISFLLRLVRLVALSWWFPSLAWDSWFRHLLCVTHSPCYSSSRISWCRMHEIEATCCLCFLKNLKNK